MSTETNPTVNFSTFLMGLGTAALVHLGEVEDPSTGKKNVQLEYAKQHIDILGVLEEKTRGNLSAEEIQLLSHLLSDLRLRYALKN